MNPQIVAAAMADLVLHCAAAVVGASILATLITSLPAWRRVR